MSSTAERRRTVEPAKEGFVKSPSPDSLVTRLRLGALVFCLVFVPCPPVWSQIKVPGPTSPPAQPADVPKDALGRTTPRGTVLGFMTSARKGDYELAARYLNLTMPGKDAAVLAEQLSVVLDRRLPARLLQLSDNPEGSLSDLLSPDRDLVGTITSANGDVNIFLERVNQGKSGPVWLFSSETLKSIPDLYEEVNVVPVSEVLPRFLVTNRIAGVPLFEWVSVFVGLPLLYLLAGLLNRILSILVGQLWRRLRKQADLPIPEILPVPARLLLIAVVIHLLLSEVGLSLLARLFWSGISTVIGATATLWILILLNGRAEKYARRYLQGRNLAGATSLLRLARRLVDVLLIFTGALGILYYFGVSPTAGLAGLGVGGIAVALAAQKTLENVIGGASMVFDQVVRAGDTLKVGDTVGTVDEVGLRSTRIRTLDRTVVSVPNGQIANMSLETLSVRDKFWFHPLINLRYETSVGQIQAVVNHVRTLLLEHGSVERSSVRVRFLGFGSSSLNVDVFAYVYARDWSHFLEIQEGLLFAVMEIVQQAGTQIALPSQILHFTDPSSADLLRSSVQSGGHRDEGAASKTS